MVQVAKIHLHEVFNQSQFSATSHERLTKQLKQLYDKLPDDVFLNEFIQCLQVPLIHGEKHRVVENTLNFASKFIASLLQTKPAKASGTRDEEEEEEEEEEICPFVLNILKFLFENHNSEHQAIRFRVCQFINKILNGLGNEACMDDNLCDRITDCMMERLQDKAPAVRMQAVLALHRLQDPMDSNCPVMKAFLFHMSCDPNPDVRRAVITNIGTTTQSIRAILDRTHDVKDSVRRTAYISLSKLGVLRFTIIQRVRLLTDGLKDDSSLVQDSVCKIMLPSWLQYYKGSFLSLLHALDCENSTEISTLALQALFKIESMKSVLEELTKLLDEDKVIPIEKLNAENVLYWRVLTEYLEAHPEIADECPIDEPLPEILPELSTFCNYIKHYYEVKSAVECEHWMKQQHQYILIQILELSKGFDLADEMGRTNLKNLCLYLLSNTSVSEDIVPIVVQLMVKIIPNVEDRLQALAEVISDLRDPMTEQDSDAAVTAAPRLSAEEKRQVELKQASIRVKINELKEEQDDAIREQDFLRAQNFKEEYQKLQVELKTLTETLAAPEPQPRAEPLDAVKEELVLRKCLRIVREMVQSDTVRTLSATLRSLMQNFVIPCLQEDNSSVVRNKALEALGLFCLLDKALAHENFLMFCFQIANDEVCEVAVKVTFDLLLLYGLETFQVREENGEASVKKKSKKKKNLFVTDMYDDDIDTEEEESQETQTSISSGSSGNTSNLISMLTSLLDSSSTSMRNLAMEGLYRLLMACRITSSALVSRLILMWYSPVTDGDEQLRQPLGAFLTLYSSQCPRSQETLEQAFLPTLKTLMQAPVTSPLTQIDQDSVTRLFIQLTRPGINKSHSKMSHIHNNLAISICNAVMDCDDSTNISVLLRGLSTLELALDDSVYREELKTLIGNGKQLFKQSKEKSFLRYLEKISLQIDAAADNVSMRTTEVDNTAATSQLDADDLSTNISANSESQGKHNKNAKLLHPHMDSILSQGDADDDDEDEENSQKAPPLTSDIVIPPSPPQSQDSDGEDEDESSQEEVSKRVRKQQQDSRDDVFKKPAARGKAPRTRGREPIMDCPSSKVDFSSSAKGRRVVDDNRVKQTSKVQQTKSERGRRAKSQNDEYNDTTTKQTTGDHDDQELSDASIVEAVGIGRSPKRHISPTEKGATLKTFQNISPNKAENIDKRALSSPSASSPRASPIPKRMKKASHILTSDDEVTLSTTAAASEMSDSGSRKKNSPVRPTRRSVSFQADSDSHESSPSSAAQLSQQKVKNVQKNMRQKRSPKEYASDSDQSPPPTRRSSTRLDRAPNATRKSRVNTPTPGTQSSTAPDTESESSPLPKRGRFASASSLPAKKATTRSKGTCSQTGLDQSPVPAISSRSHNKEGPSTAEITKKQSSKMSVRNDATTDSDSSPLPASKLRRLRGKDAALSSQNAVSESKSSRSKTPSSVKSSQSSQTPISEESSQSTKTPNSESNTDLDSDALPSKRQGRKGSKQHFVRGIEKLSGKPLPARATRKSVSQSDLEVSPRGEESFSSDPSPSVFRTRRSLTVSEAGRQSSCSPVSATQLKSKLPYIVVKKLKQSSKIKISKEKQSPQTSSQVSRATRKTASKKVDEILRDTSSDAHDTDVSQSSTQEGYSSGGKEKDKLLNSTPTQPEKKMRIRPPSKDSPVILPARRSLRSQTETPSPRTRSGKSK